MTTDLYRDGALFEQLLTCLDSAEETIHASVYQVSPRTRSCHRKLEMLWEAIARAPSRGVACSIIIDAGARNLNQAAGAEMAFEQFRKLGWVTALCYGMRMAHAKLTVIDGHTTIIGSHNWTLAALAGNFEASAIIYDEKTAAEASAIMGEWWAVANKHPQVKR